MIGCRPLTDTEIDRLKACIELSIRDRCLLILGCTTGFRISELLSLRWSDVLDKDRVTVVKRNRKGRARSHSALLHPEAKAALDALQYDTGPILASEEFIFKSKKGGHINRQQAWRVLRDAFKALNLRGPLGTHCMRKSFAAAVYAGSDKDLVVTAKALGHANINSTVSYLSFQTEQLDSIVLNMRRGVK